MYIHNEQNIMYTHTHTHVSSFTLSGVEVNASCYAMNLNCITTNLNISTNKWPNGTLPYNAIPMYTYNVLM